MVDEYPGEVMPTEFSHESLKRELKELEGDTSCFRYERSTLLSNIVSKYEKLGNNEEAKNIMYEAAAFMLCEHGDSFTGYFQPMAVFTSGATVPPREFFSPEALQYLEKRANTTHNPIIASRFADVVWDLPSQKNPKMARLAIDKYLECAEIYMKNLWGVEFSISIKRIVQLATVINDVTRLKLIKDIVLKKLAELDEKRDYRFCLDLAEAIASASRIKLDESEAKKVEEILNRGARYYQEDHTEDVTRLGPTKAPNEHFVRSFHESISNLSSTKHLLKVDTNLHRVEIARSHEREGDKALENKNYLAAVFFLQNAERHFNDLGMSYDRDRVRVKLAQAGLKSEEDLKTISTEITIEKAKIDEYIHPLLAGTAGESLKRIASAPHFIPSVDRAERLTTELRQKYPLQYLISRVHLKEGHVVGSFSKDSDIHNQAIVNQLVMEIRISNIFLRHLFDKLINELGLNAEMLTKHFEEWGLCKQRNLALLKKGFEHYFWGDYVSALHILIPQFEDTLRSLLEKAQRPISRPGYGVAILKYLLEDETFKTAAGIDLIRYYQVVLCETTGMNLRNDLSHGLLDPESMTRGTVEIVIHLLLTLTRFTINAK